MWVNFMGKNASFLGDCHASLAITRGSNYYIYSEQNRNRIISRNDRGLI